MALARTTSATSVDNLYMEVKDLVQQGNTLEAKFSIKNTKTDNSFSFSTNVSPEYKFNGIAVFQIKVIGLKTNQTFFNVIKNAIMIRFAKLNRNNILPYIMIFSSNELGITNKRFISDNDTWYLIHENTKDEYIFDISVRMDIDSQASSFATLHDDTELTDFKLRVEDGSVHVHRAVIAASSSVLKRNLCSTWREKTEGLIEVPGTTRTTLQHFKDYMYLNILPDTNSDLEQLLLLSLHCMMPDLEERCVYKLINSLTAQNAWNFFEFAVQHNLKRLILAIFDAVQRGSIKVDDMYEHFLQNQ